MKNGENERHQDGIKLRSHFEGIEIPSKYYSVLKKRTLPSFLICFMNNSTLNKNNSVYSTQIMKKRYPTDI